MQRALILLMYVVLAAILAYFAFDLWRPDLLLVGNVTVDVVGSGSGANGASDHRPGGAVTYAAAVADGLGSRACIVTTAGDEDHARFGKRHEAHVLDAASTLTFRHTYTWFGNSRKLQVVAEPDHALTASDVPWRCRMAKVVLVGPLTATDVDASSFTRPRSPLFRLLLRCQHVGVMAQGLQRTLDKQGGVRHLRAPSERLLNALTRDTSVFLSDVETDPWPRAQFDRVVGAVKQLVVTRGARGVSAYAVHGAGAQREVHVPAQPIKAVDTNGAGDTFATGYMLTLARGKSAQEALVAGTWMASRVCLQPQECKPACCSTAVREQPGDAQPRPQVQKPAQFAEPRLQPEDHDSR